jgi:hypothetical protein
MLSGINERKLKAQELNRAGKKDREFESELREKVMKIFVEYVYAGKEKDAWEFFDKEYTPGDKEELKAEIRATLDECAIYKAIYRR